MVVRSYTSQNPTHKASSAAASSTGSARRRSPEGRKAAFSEMGKSATWEICRYPLVMTNSLPWNRWPIEIDGLPNLKLVIFHGYVK